MRAALRHIKRLWGPWWPLPCLPVSYAALMWLIGDFRPEHAAMAGVCAVLAFTSRKTKQFLVDITPYLLVAFGYDLVRYARHAFLTPERVIGCGLRKVELSLFAVSPGMTAQDWFAEHHSSWFDLIFAVPYTIFVYLAFGYAAWLYFQDRPRMRHYLWSFAIANYLSYALWLLVPAAPPWYIRAHGCAIDLSVQPSAAGLLRVDHLLGIHYFEGFYGRAASVFGAMPSMHCAYPLIGLLTAWHAASFRTRPLHVLYAVVMFIAAVYLDHHWILDALAGWTVAIVAVCAARRLLGNSTLASSVSADSDAARLVGPESP